MGFTTPGPRTGEMLRLPNRLNPAMSQSMLPEINADDVRTIGASGLWSRLGIVVAIIDDRGKYLMLEHRSSDKTYAGQWGPLAETSHYSTTKSGDIQVEQPAQTLARSIREELGVASPDTLGLMARATGAWILDSWPVGKRYKDQFALAVSPVVHIGGEGREQLEDFTGTEEISAVDFMDPEEIQDIPTRRGVGSWLGNIASSGLTRAGELAKVQFANPMNPPGRDVIFVQ